MRQLAHMYKAGVSYLMTGCRDQSSFSVIIPVKSGWLVGMHSGSGGKQYVFLSPYKCTILHHRNFA